MNPIAKLQKWMDSPSGQVFMNYAYSWGAAVVVLGALFKLTHIPGANTILFVSMITEVFVFFISMAATAVCGLLMKKKGWSWLGDYALPFALLIGMAGAIPLTAWLG